MTDFLNTRKKQGLAIMLAVCAPLILAGFSYSIGAATESHLLVLIGKISMLTSAGAGIIISIIAGIVWSAQPDHTGKISADEINLFVDWRKSLVMELMNKDKDRRT